MKTLTLGVCFGSRTCEHDVSIISGIQCMDAAEKAGYAVVPVYISREGLWYTGSPLRDVKTYQDFTPDRADIQRIMLDPTPGSGRLLHWPPRKKGLFGGGPEEAAKIDVFVPVMHGLNGEDGTLQGLLELADMPYTSSGVAGCAVAMDKILMKYALGGANLPVLPGTWCTRAQYEADPEAVLRRIEGELPYPVFVKPANLGSSIGIGRGADRESLREAIEVAASFDDRILVERGLESPVEVNCSVLGVGEELRVSVCEMPLSGEEFLSFGDKYLSGGKQQGAKSGMQSQARRIPAPIDPALTKRVQDLARDAFVALAQKGVVRVDMMIDPKDQSVYINELNSIPGSLSFYLWAEEQLSFEDLVDQMVEAALKAHAERRRSVYAYDSNILASYMKGTGSKSAKR